MKFVVGVNGCRKLPKTPTPTPPLSPASVKRRFLREAELNEYRLRIIRVSRVSFNILALPLCIVALIVHRLSLLQCAPQAVCLSKTRLSYGR